MLEVYLDPCTVNSRKVLAGLDLIGTPYHYNHVDYFAGEHKSEDYKKINPHATVPAAVDGDCHITESNAILQYAADHTGNGDSPAYPKDLKRRAQINKWLLWESSVWFQSNYIYLVEYVVKPLLKADPDEATIAAEAPNWNKNAEIMDAQLAKTKWLTGDEPSIADIAVAAPMHLHAAQRLPLEKYPNLRRWLTGDIEKLPCWQKTQDAVNKALLPQATYNGTATNGTNGGYPTSVQATFNFTKDLGSKLTELYLYDHPASKDAHAPADDPQKVTIYSGWARGVDSFSADKEGFSLHPFSTQFTQWEDQAVVSEKFYPEIVSFVKESTGAKRVLVFDHTIRTVANQNKKLTDQTNTTQRAPVQIVHCDYTSESGPTRVKQLLPDEATDLLSRRVAFYNVWKPIHNIVLERPLAMCDMSTSPPPGDDFFKLHLRYQDRNGENYVMKYNEKHKWYYFPEMTPEQVLLLKTFDSEMDGRARFVAHTAFEDPTSKPDAPMRESVEIRTIAFF